MVKSALEDVEYMQQLNTEGEVLASRGYPHMEFKSFIFIPRRGKICLTQDQANYVYN